MKNNRLFFLIIFVFIILIFPLQSLASNNTYTRTIEEPLVPKDVVISDSNIDDVLKTPAVSSSEKIYDYADLYTEKEEKKLYKKVKEFIKYSDIDVVIVTTKDMNGYSIKDYAYHFYDYNDFKMDGVVFVIYINESMPEIFMGNSGDSKGKVFSIYTGDRINQILKYIYPDIKSFKYYSATNTYIKILQGFYNLEHKGVYKVTEQGKIVKVIPWLEIFILSIAMTFIVTMLFVYQLRGYRKISCKGFFGRRIDTSTLNVKIEKDEFVGFVTDEKK